jgi:hypothetical protein
LCSPASQKCFTLRSSVAVCELEASSQAMA